MPNRILKQTICTSPNLNALSMGAENMFYRLIVQADDFGRYHATPSILRGHCYPLRLDGVTDQLIIEWMNELIAADLLFVYESGRYLQITNWSKHQSQRATTSKFPEPTPDASNGKQMQADASKCAQMSPYSYSYSGTGTYSGTADAEPPALKTKVSNPSSPKADSAHVALQAFRDVRHCYPVQECWPQIIETVGDAPAALKLWSAVLVDWVATGYSPKNITGPLEWFKAGGKPSRTNGNGAYQPPQLPRRVLRGPNDD